MEMELMLLQNQVMLEGCEMNIYEPPKMKRSAEEGELTDLVVKALLLALEEANVLL